MKGNENMKYLKSRIIKKSFYLFGVSLSSYLIYFIGYNKGKFDFLYNEEENKQILMQKSFSSIETLKITRFPLNNNNSNSSCSCSSDISEEMKRIRVIGKRIIEAAQLYCKEKYEIELEKEKEKKGSNIEELEKWKSACKRLKGEWTVNYIDSKRLLVFVTSIYPCNFFIAKGFLETIQPTDEELALILSHEVSHLIYQHSKKKYTLQGLLSGIHLSSFALISPNGSLLFYLSDILSSLLFYIYYASQSRKFEVEADLTGLEITSKACYDTKQAAKVFSKFSQHKSISSSGYHLHPSDHERVRYLTEMSENYVQSNHSNINSRNNS